MRIIATEHLLSGRNTARPSVAAAAARNRWQGEVGGTIGKEAWDKAWLGTRRGKNISWRRGGGIRGLGEYMVDEFHRHATLCLQDASTDAPETWRVTRAVILPKSTSLEFEPHRPVVPSAPLVAWVSRSSSCEVAQRAPTSLWPVGRREGVRKCGEGVVLEGDPFGAFGPMRYPLI